ncbi:hypothetical protein F2P56_034081 [Juglans regia]|uniref:Uncharacterized protein LOC108992312 n=2 Tax=Juglans regia TaxID=51240 RepID=A0A2I4ESL1_JUGRE|nr:uncharacterized protein LOC108992312 [Juglans regia]KAF5444996.1 hypothetical protein F2P56_034081 [Juglans regia]
MEVLIPASTMDFNNPTTPKRFGDYYFSAPSSPSRIPGLYRDCNEYDRRESSEASAIREEEEGDGFAFDFSEELERSSLSADELFDGGKIRPLKPPTRLQFGWNVDPYTAPNSPPLSPNSGRSHGMKTILGALSPRGKKNSDRPEMVADNSTRKITQQQRGRERNTDLPSSDSGRRATRSLSPYRVSEFPWEEDQEEEEKTRNDIKQSSLNPKASLSSSSSSSKSSKKWRLRDFLLFRSASEGRARDKDPFLKFSALYKRHEDVKNSSFRSTASSGSVSRSSRRGPPVSPHELHYTVNRAMSEDLKKKTFLPYKQGILGLLHFRK